MAPALRGSWLVDDVRERPVEALAPLAPSPFLPWAARFPARQARTAVRQCRRVQAYRARQVLR